MPGEALGRALNAAELFTLQSLPTGLQGRRRACRERCEADSQLLDENDWDVFYWATEKKEAPKRWAKTELLAK